MKKIEIKGTMNFSGFEIPNIYGGFGEGRKAVLVKTVSEIHEMPLKEINRVINNNIDEFEVGIDILDLKNNGDYQAPLMELGFSNRDISISKNIYLLSEQGYMALVSLMRTEKAKELRKKFRREYFAMKEVIEQQVPQLTKEQQLVLNIYNSNDGIERVQFARELVDLKVDEAIKPLNDKIKENEPKVIFADTIVKDGDNILIRDLAKLISDKGFTIGQNKLYDKLREWNYICKKSTQPTQYAMDRGYFILETIIINTINGAKQKFTTKVTPKGQLHIVNKIMKEVNKYY